ncbi:MAG: ADP compounds hydrolase NudE [Pseudomonadota bacterium]
MKNKPQAVASSVVAQSRLFTIESVDLQFSNGKGASFERIVASHNGVVVVMAVTSERNLVLVREYAVGREQYELGVVKGKVDPGEVPKDAAQRELKEEIGFGAERLTLLRRATVNPAYTNFSCHIFLAEALFEESLCGDEIEPLEQIHWPLDRLAELQHHPDITDVRTLYSLYALQGCLDTRKHD